MGRKRRQQSVVKHTGESKAEARTQPEGHSAAMLTVPKQALIAVFAMAFVLYANTLSFDYALDDKLYITANEFTKQGFSGIGELWTNDMMTGFFGKKKNLVEGGRYRPLALTTHAIEWELFKKNPAISHFINVVLYGLLAVVLLLVLSHWFKAYEQKTWWWSLPMLATALFIAHPLHTEVTANIKSRDEIMSLLFALMSVLAVYRFFEDKKSHRLILAGLWFWCSLASKESSVTFLGVLPLSILFFTSWTWRKMLVGMTPLVVATMVYALLRSLMLDDFGDSLEVAPELMNKPYLLATESERLASIFFTMWLYLKLLVIPHPLTHDYYPFHPFRSFEELEGGMRPYLDWGSSMPWVGLVLYLALAGIAAWSVMQRLRGRQGSIIGFSITFYLGTFILFSNLFFDIGAFMNERFMFIPSLGLAIVIAWLLFEKLSKPMATAIVALLLLGYSAKTIHRNFAWENDYALASADVGTSDGSAKVKMTMGSELLDRAKEASSPQEKQLLLKQAELYCQHSLKIYPRYFPPRDILGNIYYEMERYDLSVQYFAEALKMKSHDKRIRNNMEAVGNTAVNKGDFQSALQAYEVLALLNKKKEKSRYYSLMGEVYGKHLNDLKNSKAYLMKALKADEENGSVHQKLGIVYAMTGKQDSAMLSFNRALELDPTNARVLLNLGILYNQLGDPTKGAELIEQAKAIDPGVMGGQ